MERRRRLDDTYVGIIVGALAVFIVLIVGVSLFIGLRLRRKKYGSGGTVSGGFIGVGGSAGRSPKFIYSRGAGNDGLKTANGVVVGGGGGGNGVGGGGYNTIVVEMDNRLNKEMSLLNQHNRTSQPAHQTSALMGRQNSGGSQQTVSLLSPTLNGTTTG